MKLKWKQIVAAALTGCLIFSGCGQGGSPEKNTKTESEAEKTQAASSEREQEAEEAAEAALSHLTSKSTVQYQGSIPYVSGEIFAMDTYMTLTLYGEECEDALDACFAEIIRLDDLLSVGNPDSEISRINAQGSGTVSDDTAAMIELSLSIQEKSEGYFDITVLPLMELWGFTSGDFRVPEETEIQELLGCVGSGTLNWNASERTLELTGAKGIDLGGIAKGYTSDRMMQIFKEYNLTAGLVSLGGNVEVYRTKTDGSLWRCGVKDPEHPDDQSQLLGIISVQDCAVITSGGYERYFTDEVTQKTYHHILDPHTGWPAESGLLSVTIVSPSGVLADGLSTAVFAMGLEMATEFWHTYGDSLGFDMILMTEDGKLYVTEPIQEQFSSEREIQVIQ